MMQKIIWMFCLICFIFIFTPRKVNATIEVYDRFEKRVASFQDREAPFEDDIPTMMGYIVMADPPDGCSEIISPKFFTNFTFGKFVLINGSEPCGFKRKIINAEKAGFDLAVIFDPTPHPLGYVPFVHFPGFEINIPVLLVSFEDGLIIRSNYLYNNSYYYNFLIKVKPNIPDFSYYMYLFGAVIGLCFFIMLLFMICLLVKCIQERRKSRRNRLSSRQIRQIPTAKFSKGDQYDVCAICLEDYKEGDKLRILPCSHAYHAKCIDQWLMNNRRNCPLCKRKITFGDSDDSDSEDSELTSPAENTPLLTSPTNQGQSWGTFVNPVRTINDMDSAGPSSAPESDQYGDSPRLHVAQTNAVNPFASDSEYDTILPSPDCSINACRNENVSTLGVQVNIVNSFQNSSNSAAIV